MELGLLLSCPGGSGYHRALLGDSGTPTELSWGSRGFLGAVLGGSRGFHRAVLGTWGAMELSWGSQKCPVIEAGPRGAHGAVLGTQEYPRAVLGGSWMPQSCPRAPWGAHGVVLGPKGTMTLSLGNSETGSMLLSYLP